MRTIIGAAVLALGMAAQPAFAGEGAAPLQGTAAPLYTAVAVTPAVAPALAMLTDGAIAQTPSFRLASIVLPAGPAASPLS